jgi:hypothetical protein
MSKWSISLILIVLILLIPFISSFNFDGTSTSSTVLFGNLTNLSEMQDVNIPAPTDGNVLTWNDASKMWIDSLPSAGAELDPKWSANYSTYLTKPTWATIMNGTLATWNQVMNGTIGGITWANAVNGTLALTSSIPINNNQLVNGFAFYNSTTAPIYLNDTFAGNYTNFTTVYGYALNSTDTDTFVANYSDYLITKAYSSNDTDFNSSGLIKDWNALGFIKDWWINIVNGTMLSQATFNTNYTANDVAYRDKTNTSYYLDSNPNSYYNITTAPIYINDTFGANYSTFLTHIDWAKVVNGTMAKTSDLINYNSSGLIKDWNATGLIKTWTDSDTFVANYSDYLITKTYASNDTDFNSSGLIKDWNASGFIKDWTSIAGISWANAVNGTLALSSAIPTNNNQLANGFNFYNSTTAPIYLNDTFAGNYTNFTTVYGYALNDTNWNSSGLIKDWNASGLIKTWTDTDTFAGNYSNFTTVYGYALNSTDTDTFVANYSTFLTHITWANAINGTLALTSDLSN